MSYPFKRTKTEAVWAVTLFKDFLEGKFVDEIDAKVIIDMVKKAVSGEWIKNYLDMDSLIDECFNSNRDGLDLMWGEKDSELRGKDLKDFVRWMFKIPVPDRDWIPACGEDGTSLYTMSYTLISNHFKSYHYGLSVVTDKSFYSDERQPAGMSEIDKPLQIYFQLNAKKFDTGKAEKILFRLYELKEEERFEARQAFEERLAKEKADFEREQEEKAALAEKKKAEKALNLARVTEQISAIVAELQKRGFPADHEKCRLLIEEAVKIVVA